MNYEKILEKKRQEFYAIYEKPKPTNVTINDFDIIRMIGKGAFGRVVLVKHKKSNCYYAMKTLSKVDVIQSKQVENTVREKKLLNALDHPFIMSLFVSFKDNKYLYLVLPFISGGEMFELLIKMEKFPADFVLFYGSQVLLAFEYLHYLNVAYRDLKPENILICNDGYLKVTDLGFAKIVPDDKRTWTLCGTPDYMAPEIILNRGHTYYVDWWAFGVLLYEMTCGYAPFTHSNDMKIFNHIINGKVNYPANFPKMLKNLTKNLLQHDISSRYGCLKRGVLDIKEHPYFSSINFTSLFNKDIVPPYKPVSLGPGDSSAFKKMEEERFDTGGPYLYEREFMDF